MSTPYGLGNNASPVGEDRTTTNPPDGGMAAPSLYGERGGLGYNPARPEGRGLPDRPRRKEGEAVRTLLSGTWTFAVAMWE